MTHITEARVIGNHFAMGRSTPAAPDRPYLSIHEILRESMCRAAGRKDAAERKDKDMAKDMAMAQSRWDTDGGANEAVE